MRIFALSWLLLTASAGVAGAAGPGAAPTPAPTAPPHPAALIFDTDLGNDVDDALALGLLHALQSRGQCRILAVTLTNPEPLAGAYIAAVNTFYGRGTIPIGLSPTAPRVSRNRFVQLAEAVDEHGRRLYPSDFDPARAPAAVALLRQTLAAAADRSVVIVQTGFSTNLARLLASPADAISALPGAELVARKVRLLSLMGGAFHTVNGNAHYLEFNIRYDIPAAVRLAREWPTPIVWSGYEVGAAVLFPAASVDHDFSYVPHHPIREAYQLYRPTPHERPTWDVTSALYAVWPDRDGFTLSTPGKVTVDADGFTHFTPLPGGRDRYLIVDEAQAAGLRALFAALVSQPPDRP